MRFDELEDHLFLLDGLESASADVGGFLPEAAVNAGGKMEGTPAFARLGLHHPGFDQPLHDSPRIRDAALDEAGGPLRVEGAVGVQCVQQQQILQPEFPALSGFLQHHFDKRQTGRSALEGSATSVLVLRS